MSERRTGTVRAPDFPAGLEWLNTETPLRLADLRGRLVLLDFWTYCCINCQHVLPQLRKLEERFGDDLAVIGVHSAKFPAEGETWNLRQAVMRHDLRHPVVNDRNFSLWRAYAVKAWPTVVLVGPDGYVVGQFSGEFEADRLAPGLAELIEQYRASGLMRPDSVPTVLERWKLPETLLSFPGKVLADPAADRLFVADTDHHRVLCFGLREGRLRAAYGSGEAGLTDGEAGRARFREPQGLALHQGALLVADTGNHALRRVALDSGVVSLLAGNGEQASPWPEEGPCREARLNSPWDVVTVGDHLFVALAGAHQIWRLHLRSGHFERFAGDGHEALYDAPRRESRLAQPSGLASDGERLWFVDSESSSLRFTALEGEGEVRTAVGQGLFEFGDSEGGRETARFQHPLGVACAGGRVFIADSYNHRIKVYDPRAGEVSAFAGSGEPGCEDGPAEEACFWEPGGLCAAGECLYVADTNNHAVRQVDLTSGEVRTVRLRE
jgi:thiol-disulfide isomerase/thioredoxin